jgi:hypothetical protein
MNTKFPISLAAGSMALSAMTVSLAAQQTSDSKFFEFPMVVSGGASTCLPKANGRVTIHSIGPVEIMHVFVSDLPPKTDFDFFVIQVPKAPFGMSGTRAILKLTGMDMATVFLLAVLV